MILDSGLKGPENLHFPETSVEQKTQTHSTEPWLPCLEHFWRIFWNVLEVNYLLLWS